MRLEGKLAVVTGAATGIGHAAAQALCEEGAHSVVADIDAEGAERAAVELRQKGHEATSIRIDISKVSDIKRCVRGLLERYSKIDILVNNAGLYSTVSIPMMTEGEWDRVMNVNLKGTFFLSKEVLPSMIERRYGKIVNVASLAAKRGGVTSGVNYGASKAGVVSVTKYLATYAAPFGVNVNAVVPGFAETKMFRMNSPEKIVALLKTIPLGRVARPEELGKAIAFLASDDASYITGEIMDVNGGIHMD
jgi:NAD(P)-dependent dehydrogenase (short-subunit alcohol dehydrogenase family)